MWVPSLRSICPRLTTPLDRIAAPTLKPLRKGESINEAMVNGNFLQSLPNFVRKGMSWALRNYSSPPGRNDDWAGLLDGFGMCSSIDEERTLFAKKDIYLEEWHKSLNNNSLDFVLTLPFPTPAFPKNSTAKVTFMSASGCFMYNFVRHSVQMVFNAVPDHSPHYSLARLLSWLRPSHIRRQERRFPSQRFRLRSGIRSHERYLPRSS